MKCFIILIFLPFFSYAESKDACKREAPDWKTEVQTEEYIEATEGNTQKCIDIFQKIDDCCFGNDIEACEVEEPAKNERKTKGAVGGAKRAADNILYMHNRYKLISAACEKMNDKAYENCYLDEFPITSGIYEKDQPGQIKCLEGKAGQSKALAEQTLKSVAERIGNGAKSEIRCEVASVGEYTADQCAQFDLGKEKEEFAGPGDDIKTDPVKRRDCSGFLLKGGERVTSGHCVTENIGTADEQKSEASYERDFKQEKTLTGGMDFTTPDGTVVSGSVVKNTDGTFEETDSQGRKRYFNSEGNYTGEDKGFEKKDFDSIANVSGTTDHGAKTDRPGGDFDITKKAVAKRLLPKGSQLVTYDKSVSSDSCVSKGSFLRCGKGVIKSLDGRQVEITGWPSSDFKEKGAAPQPPHSKYKRDPKKFVKITTTQVRVDPNAGQYRFGAAPAGGNSGGPVRVKGGIVVKGKVYKNVVIGPYNYGKDDGTGGGTQIISSDQLSKHYQKVISPSKLMNGKKLFKKL